MIEYIDVTFDEVSSANHYIKRKLDHEKNDLMNLTVNFISINHGADVKLKITGFIDKGHKEVKS